VMIVSGRVTIQVRMLLQNALDPKPFCTSAMDIYF